MKKIKAILLVIACIASWMISFYSFHCIFKDGAEPLWYHYADGWGFGVLFLILFFPAVAYNTKVWFNDEL